MFTVNGTPWPSVNESTDPTQAPLNALSQLGHVLPHLVHAIATSLDEQGPWVFMKLDIKDGFWRLMVPTEDEYSFCYVLPQMDPEQPTQIVVPSALQMGWTGSMDFFSSASETS